MAVWGELISCYTSGITCTSEMSGIPQTGAGRLVGVWSCHGDKMCVYVVCAKVQQDGLALQLMSVQAGAIKMSKFGLTAPCTV
jgi:hypothetical protein